MIEGPNRWVMQLPDERHNMPQLPPHARSTGGQRPSEMRCRGVHSFPRQRDDTPPEPAETPPSHSSNTDAQARTPILIQPRSYEAYVSRTNEKSLLRTELGRAFRAGELPIRPGDTGKRILDLGCGLGTNTLELMSLFPGNMIVAIDKSPDMIAYAEQHVPAPNGGLHLEVIPFEDFRSARFDFILCSHVLQYIDTPLRPFVRKMLGSLLPGGEIWVVLQEEIGLNTLILHSRPHLAHFSPYFEHWIVHEHVRRLLRKMDVNHVASKFRSHFLAPDFEHFTEEDQLLLDFVFLGGFNPKDMHLVDELARSIRELSDTRSIPHDVGITKIRRRH